MRRRIVAGAAVLCVVVIGLSGLLISRAQPTSPIVASVPIGTGPGLSSWLPIDEKAGRAYLLDDGVIDPTVTLAKSGGYSWPAYQAINTSMHVIDTRSGRLLAALPVSDSTDDIAVDPYTHRLFTFDRSNGQIQVYDTRRETLVGSLPWNSKVSINALLIDPRGGRVYALVAGAGGDHPFSPGSTQAQPVPRHLLMLDGSSGRTLRSIAFPHGPRVVEQQSYGYTRTYFMPSLSMTLDARAGRLYVFDNRGRMSVLDSASGRLLYARRLGIPVAGARVDERTGRIFAFDASRNPAMKDRMIRAIAQDQRVPLHPGTVLMLDARSGAILRRISAGTTRSGAGEIAVDQSANHVLIANVLSDTVSVLDGANGAVLRTMALGGIPYEMALDARHHRAALRVGAGYSIVVLDTRSGRLLRTITLPWKADSLALDPASGHILVTTSALLPLPADRWGWLPPWLRDHIPGLPPPAPTPDPSRRLLHSAVITLDPAR